MTDAIQPDQKSGLDCDIPGAAQGKALSDAAKRALREAEIRRRKAYGQAGDRPSETDGPSGPEPTRYGDWEKAGRAYDF